VGDFGVVETRDRKLVRGGQARLGRRRHHTEGHCVIAGEHRRRAILHGEERAAGLQAAQKAEIPVAHQGFVPRHAPSGQGVQIAALTTGRTAMLRRPAHEADPPMA